ncbi:MAG TPA: sugar ABC transporter substrate-binding protein [Roseiflexaceae bacterium]|nr:sugar ABC transporter substrate-binding protein [Roseiflexaceae bacterium]
MRKMFGCIVTLCLLILAACGGAPAATTPPTAAPASSEPTAAPAGSEPTAAPAETQPTAAPATGESVTLRIALVDYKDEHKTWLEQQVIPAFQKDHPGVTVEPIYLNWGTLNETYAGYFAAGDGPDILNMGSEFGPEYGDRLLPLNQYLKEWPELEQYIPATLATTTWKDELRGLPWLVMPRVYMCRTDLLQEAGLSGLPTTFEQAVADAKAATVVQDNKLMRAGIWTNGAAQQELEDWQEFIQLIWAAGGQLYKADGSPNFDSPEAKTALQFMFDRKRAVLENEQIARLGEAQGSRLSSGEVACMWNNVWGAPDQKDAIWSKIELGPSPSTGSGKPVVTIFTDWLAVPQYTKNPELAVEFLKLLGNKENQTIYNDLFGSFSPRKDAAVANPVMQKQVELMDQYGVAWSDIRVAPKLQEIVQAELPLFLQGNQDIDTTVQSLQGKYTDALREAGRIQ